MRTFYGCLAGLVAAVCANAAFAQAFPSQPISLIVPWPPGGGSDIAMRLVADTASKKIGVPVVVVNKPGAGGTIGLKEVATSKPDGYTIGMIATGAIFAQYNNPNANAMSDFDVFAFFGDDPALLSASSKTGFKNVADFINAAKASPGKIKNGNDQPGGSSHITISLMEKKLGVRVTKVPYAGFAPTVQGMLSGEVDTVTVPAPDIVQHHKSGAARILGVAATQRNATFLRPTCRLSASRASISSPAPGVRSPARKACPPIGSRCWRRNSSRHCAIRISRRRRRAPASS